MTADPSGPVQSPALGMTRRIAVAAVVSGCLSSAVPAQDPAPLRPRPELTQLDTLLGKDDAAGAVALLARLQPQLDANERFALDAVYVLVGRRRFEEAREQWARAAPRLQESLKRASAGDSTPAAQRALQRRVAEAWFVQGLLEARFGAREDALRLLKDADGLGFPPLDSPLMILAGDCLRGLQEHALAAQAYQEVVKREPKDARARLGLGLSLYAAGNMAGAREQLEETLRLAPGTPGAHYGLGAALFELKRYDEARAHLERELGADARCAPCLARLAHIAYLAGDERQCESWLARAAELDPDNTEASLVSGLLAYRRGAYDEAVTHLSRVVRQAPAYARAQYQLGLAYQRLGNEAKASEHLGVYRKLIDQEKARTIGVRGSE